MSGGERGGRGRGRGKEKEKGENFFTVNFVQVKFIKAIFKGIFFFRLSGYRCVGAGRLEHLVLL